MCRCATSSLLWLLTLLATSTGALDKPDISWGDWIIIEDSAPADSGATILLRRITPKSVFVAPNFNTCPEGYRQDALGRCVKVVQVNKEAQWNFFLEKLNSMYAATPSPVGKESGPLHFNLPIGGGPSKETPPRPETTPVTTTLFDTEVPSTIEDLITTIKVDRDTTKVEQEDVSDVYQQTTHDQETTTKSVQETTRLDQESIVLDQEATKLDQASTVHYQELDQETSVLDQETTKLDQGTTKSYQETINSTTTYDQENSTSKTEQSTNLDTTVSMREFETETSLPESKKKQIDAIVRPHQDIEISETVKRPFIIVVTGGTEIPESTTEEPTTTSEAEAATVTVEPIKVKLPNSVKSKCDLSVQVSQLNAAPGSNIDCEPLEPPVTSTPPATVLVPPPEHVRFPSASNVPVRKAPGLVRFPEDARIRFRWPLSWEYQKHPDILAWPTSSIRHTQSWSNSPPWTRRIIQRD